jgi:diguanylate cyclase (GGDEF)-like protein
MSLIKQLWIAIAVVAAFALGGSLTISALSTRDFMERELFVKNLDNATSLALSMSQMPKDPVTVELLVAAQFDTGHYRLISLTSPEGEAIVEREQVLSLEGAPAWLARFIAIDAPAGVAQVQDGWHQFGTLTLAGDTRHTYQALWDSMLRLLLWFTIGAALTGVLGTLLVKRITRPLQAVVGQAEAVGARRFVTTEESGPLEFRAVVRAMNKLVANVQAMLGREAERLEALRRQAQMDETTGLANRAQFLRLADAALTREDAHTNGTLVIARIEDLAAHNQTLGRDHTDRLLREIAQCFEALADEHDAWAAGRLNGTDLALLAAGADDASAICERLRTRLRAVVEAWQSRMTLRIPMGAAVFTHGEARGALLAKVDGALAAAEQASDLAVHVAPASTQALPHATAQAWREALEQALEHEGVRLGHFPVMSADGGILHFECPMRLRLDGDWQPAGYFMPWATRLNLVPRLDLEVIRAALARIAETRQPLGVNIASESLASPEFRVALPALLASHPKQSRQLWMEVSEYGVRLHLAEFRALCLVARPFGCKLGIEHAGPQLSRIGGLEKLGLDYLKVDASMIRDVDREDSNHEFLRSLCNLAHGIGIRVIAEGVSRPEEAGHLIEIGFDAFTGPAIRLPEQQA